MDNLKVTDTFYVTDSEGNVSGSRGFFMHDNVGYVALFS